MECLEVICQGFLEELNQPVSDATSCTNCFNVFNQKILKVHFQRCERHHQAGSLQYFNFRRRRFLVKRVEVSKEFICILNCMLMGIASVYGVICHLRALQRKGYIKRGVNQARAISLTSRSCWSLPYGGTIE